MYVCRLAVAGTVKLGCIGIYCLAYLKSVLAYKDQHVFCIVLSLHFDTSKKVDTL